MAETFYGQGGRYLFLDEVHKYENWQTAVKNIYDFLPELQIVVSGSSILALQKSRADLSRRLLQYHLTELSLREFIGLKHSIDIPAIELGQLLTNHVEIVSDLQKQINSPLLHFKQYLDYGAYPFFIEWQAEFPMRLNQLINVIIDYDLPEARAIEVSTQSKLKRLLYVLSSIVPYKPNISKLAEQIGTSRLRLLEMLHILEEAQLIRNLRSSAYGISIMNKPEKIFLSNPSMINALAEGQPEKGNLRETFFLSQLQNSGAIVTYPEDADFKVNNKWLFEIGSKSKSTEQLGNHANGFVAADEIQYGNKNKIPLWLFGFLY